MPTDLGQTPPSLKPTSLGFSPASSGPRLPASSAGPAPPTRSIRVLTEDLKAFGSRLLRQVAPKQWVIRTPTGDLLSQVGKPYPRYEVALREAIKRHNNRCPYCLGHAPVGNTGGHVENCALPQTELDDRDFLRGPMEAYSGKS